MPARASLTHVHCCTFACHSNLHHNFRKHSVSSLLCHTSMDQHCRNNVYCPFHKTFAWLVCADNANASNRFGFWLQGTRFSCSRRRSFCRSSFTAARSYETRMCRQRRRTFSMPELEPTSNNNFQVILMETQPGMPEAANGPTMCDTLLGMASSSWSKADHMMRSMVKSALYHHSGQAHDCT